jgi:DNA end-binding protein Ku
VQVGGGAGYAEAMARSIWNGTIAFGLMTVPVKLHTATDAKSVSFREVHLDDGAHIEHRRFCSKEDKEVPYKQVVKGYEVAEDKYVVLEKDEIAAAAGDRGKRIEIEHFVDAADIDPIFYEKTYYLGAGKDGARPYRVLLEALSQTGRAGVGRFTFHDREYLAAVRARDGVLVLHTLRFADELVPGDEIDVAAPGRGPGDREVKMAAQLVDTLSTGFDPAAYEDEYRAAVLDVVERKRKGEAIVPEEVPEAGEAPDLMATLKASLDGAKKGGR